MNTRVSSYFARLHDTGMMPTIILKQRLELDSINGLGFNVDAHNIKNDTYYLLKQWNISFQSLQCEHSTHHLKVVSIFLSHCYAFTVIKIIPRNDDCAPHSCRSFSQPFVF